MASSCFRTPIRPSRARKSRAVDEGRQCNSLRIPRDQSASLRKAHDQDRTPRPGRAVRGHCKRHISSRGLSPAESRRNQVPVRGKESRRGGSWGEVVQGGGKSLQNEERLPSRLNTIAQCTSSV